MPTTIPVQVRVDHSLLKAIDAHANSTNMTRAAALRELLKIAVTAPVVPAADPLNRILDALARLDVKVDECCDTSHAANINAFAAYATARLHGLMVFPPDQQKSFAGQLGPVVAKVVQP
jgi:hypothetical protein